MAREWLLRGVKPEELQRTTAPEQPATPRGKWENYWYHYKWHTLGGIFLVAVLAVMLGHLLVRNTPDYRVLLLTERAYTTQEVDALELLLTPYGEDLDGDGQVEITVTNCMLGEQVKQQYNSNIQMFQANLMAGDVMCFIWDRKTYTQQVPAVEELMQEDNAFLAQLPIEHAGLSEDGCVYNWKGSAQQRILTEMFPNRYPEELLFTVRHPNGTAEGSEELYRQGLALIKRLAAGSDKAPEGYELPTTTAAPTTTTTTTAPRITTGKTSEKHNAVSTTTAEVTTTEKKADTTKKTTKPTTKATTKATTKKTTATTAPKYKTITLNKKTTYFGVTGFFTTKVNENEYDATILGFDSNYQLMRCPTEYYDVDSDKNIYFAFDGRSNDFVKLSKNVQNAGVFEVPVKTKG